MRCAEARKQLPNANYLCYVKTEGRAAGQRELRSERFTGILKVVARLLESSYFVRMRHLPLVQRRPARLAQSDAFDVLSLGTLSQYPSKEQLLLSYFNILIIICLVKRKSQHRWPFQYFRADEAYSESATAAAQITRPNADLVPEGQPGCSNRFMVPGLLERPSSNPRQ